MRDAMVMAWIMALSSFDGRAQGLEKTPAEVLASMDADLHGRAEAMYGSSTAGQWNSMQRTPAQVILDVLNLPSPPPPPRQSAGIVSVASLRHSVPKAAIKHFERARKVFASGKFADIALERGIRKPRNAAPAELYNCPEATTGRVTCWVRHFCAMRRPTAKDSSTWSTLHARYRRPRSY
jgi:hypothetical protein